MPVVVTVAREEHDGVGGDVVGFARLVEDALDGGHGRGAGIGALPVHLQRPVPTLTMIELKRKSLRPPGVFSIFRSVSRSILRSGRRSEAVLADEASAVSASATARANTLRRLAKRLPSVALGGSDGDGKNRDRRPILRTKKPPRVLRGWAAGEATRGENQRSISTAAPRPLRPRLRPS